MYITVDTIITAAIHPGVRPSKDVILSCSAKIYDGALKDTE